MAKVSAEAIADAGLEKKDIDGFLVGMPFADPGMIYPGQRPRNALGLPDRGCSTSSISAARVRPGMIWRAAAAIDAGMCNAVLCLVADLNRTGDQRVPVVSMQREFEAPYGMIGANCGYALIARRHMYEYGTTAAADGEGRRRSAQERDSRIRSRPSTTRNSPSTTC